MEINLVEWTDSRGDSPFKEWLFHLDPLLASSVVSYLKRLSFGNFANTKNLGTGLYELKIDKGPGLRVYYSVVGKTVLLLLGGGSKTRQQKDITIAKKRLTEYKTGQSKWH